MDKNREPDKISNFGTKCWHDKNGKLHSDNRYPALITLRGTKKWYNHGIIHNNFGPASIINGERYWYIDGKEYTEEQFLQHKIKQFIDEE